MYLHAMISADEESLTQSSSTSLDHSSGTVSTASSGSTLSLLEPEEEPSPPRTVHVQPEPAPYAQLCFNREQNTLITLLVGKPRQYTSLGEGDSPGRLSSSQSSIDSEDSSCGWSTGSSSSDGDSYDWSNYDTSPQNVFWLDETWLFDESSAYSDTHRMLEGDSSFDSSETSTCGKLLRTVALCKAPKYYRATHSPFNHHHESSRKSPPKRQGKNFGYSVLH